MTVQYCQSLIIIALCLLVVICNVLGSVNKKNNVTIKLNGVE